jgi:hypothetical protein
VPTLVRLGHATARRLCRHVQSGKAHLAVRHRATYGYCSPEQLFDPIGVRLRGDGLPAQPSTGFTVQEFSNRNRSTCFVTLLPRLCLARSLDIEFRTPVPT